MKKIISLILCFLMIFSVCSVPAFADDFDDKKVLFEGECGFSEVDSVYYRYYDDGIMVISGNGVVGQITIPEWFTELWCIQIESGITGISDNAFKIWDIERCRLCRINLPATLNHIGNDVLPKESQPFHKVAICYPGIEEQWQTIHFGDTPDPFVSFNKQNCIFYLNGEEPKPFIKFSCNSEFLKYESGESIKLYLDYYLGEYQDAVIKMEESKKSLNSFIIINDLRQVKNGFMMSSSYGEELTVKASLLSQDEKTVFSSDTVNIIIDSPSKEDIFSRIKTFLTVDSVFLTYVGTTIIFEALLSPYFLIDMIVNEIIIAFERFF